MRLSKVPDGVGRTALGVARIRATESRRPDRLFEDPYASGFVAAAPGALPENRGPTGLGAALSFQVVIRTRFFDDYLLAACAAGHHQVVLLAAGLDTRAFRLHWPAQVRLFELDLPEVLAFKAEVLAGEAAAPRCERITVPADLREDWAASLTAAGLDTGQPVVWLIEGLLIYLSGDEAGAVLTTAGTLSQPGSRLSFERGGATSDLLSRLRATPGTDPLTGLWKGGLGEDAPGWLARRGWQVTEVELAELAESYGRPASGQSRSGFITAVRE